MQPRHLLAFLVLLVPSLAVADPLPGSQPLTMEGDIASQLVDGVDRFLLKRIDQASEPDEFHWKRDLSSPEAYEKSIAPNRTRLAQILGVRDGRVPFEALELVVTTTQPSLVGRGQGYEVHAVRWPVFGDIRGEGLLLVPTGRDSVADVIAIPDCEQTPEQLVGLAEGIAVESQFARRLAESGCRVVVPMLINRQRGQQKLPGFEGAKGLTNREFLYRSAFELGRGIGGYELQKILALVDYFAKDKHGLKIGVIGYGEGGRLALLASAIDSRIAATCVSGYFDNRSNLWQEPIDRNVFGQLTQFDDAHLAAMVAPRTLVVEASKGPEITLKSEGNGAPGRTTTPRLEDVKAELDRASQLVESLGPRFVLTTNGDGTLPFGSAESITPFLAALSGSAALAATGPAPEKLSMGVDAAARHARQMVEIDRHTQQLLVDCDKVRAQFMSKLDTSSPERFAQTREEYRRYFYDEVIGRFDEPLLPANPRSRKIEENNQWTRYEVVLDVFPDVIAYGLLTIPKDIPQSQKRPVIVCQHGLEGRPQHVIGEEGIQAYAAFATRLAERGYITFAPQNLYIFQDRFRTLQRKANTIGKTLFSVIVPQHQQITDWLKTLPQVDSQRIAFYGLSYGGKSAMRIPPLVKNYCLSICSADFNEWVLKNASTRHPFSYVWTSEYEIFEFDLANTFNYAEMAMLIAPRPFMVERGHHDGVGTDEWVAHEYARVYRFYATHLHQPENCEIEWFDGPHKINALGTFEFLDRHLK